MNPNSQRIFTACTACELHEHAYSVGMKPVGRDDAPLKVFMDAPPKEDDMRHAFGQSNIAQFVTWMLARIGLKEEDYQIGFTLSCAIPKNFLTKKEQKLECIDACTKFRIANLQKTKCVLAMGELSALAFLNQPLKKVVHCIWPSGEVKGLKIAVSYAPGYPLTKEGAGESVAMARLMWYAAEAAGLKPFHNPKVGLFDFNII